MANKKISELEAFQGNVQNDDLFEIVDVSDTTMAPTGTNKKVTWQDMKGDLNDIYLRLNGANGPITGDLAVTGDIDITGDYKKNGAPLSNAAADTTIVDAGDYYVSPNVEGALQELGTGIKRDNTGKLGYKVIPQNFDFSNIPADYSDSIWEIRYAHDLGAATVNLPDNVVLKFNGGKLSNGTVNLADTFIEGVKGFNKDIVLTGVLRNGIVEFDWFDNEISSISRI